MQAVQQFCLRWNNHQPNFISVFTTLLSDEALVDVTLACEGKHLQAHRVVLSACSAYFQSLFTINPCQHPIVILKDIKFKDLRTMVDFMYYGEVNVSQEQLPAILKIAEMLKIKGLADMPQPGTDRTELLTPGSEGWRRSSSPMSPAMRRKRLRKTSTGSGSGSTEQTSEEVVGELPNQSPCVKVEHVGGDSEDVRVPSRASLRTGQDPSTDSEPREGSQDSGTEDLAGRLSVGPRHLSVESRHGSFELRQLSHDSRQSSITDGRQASHERQLSHERQHSHERQFSNDRQASHDSRLSHESSIESVTTDVEASPGRERLGTKRGRLLMRQERVKKENDTHTSPDSEPGSPGFSRQRSETASPLLTPSPLTTRVKTDQPVATPNRAIKTESSPSPVFRQKSDPCVPVRPKTEMIALISPAQPNQNLLSVPQPPYPGRTLSLPARGKSVPESQDDGGHFLLVDSVPLPMVRIIPDDKSEPPSSDLTVLEPYRSGHCPVLRTGPALGCNFCWNTIDNRGRILRRKTKYHCPECQTNLCIVPCFQEYHQRASSVVGPPVTSSSTS